MSEKFGQGDNKETKGAKQSPGKNKNNAKVADIEDPNKPPVAPNYNEIKLGKEQKK